MEGTVTKLFDINDIEFPSELFATAIDEKEIEEKVALLSLKYAEETEVTSATNGDVVFCSADSQSYPDGRTIILYSGVALPDAADASGKAVGKSVGDAFEATLCETNATLTVTKIIHRTPTPITDQLIASLGIENVATVSDYKAYLRELEAAEQRTQQARSAAQFGLEYLIQHSEFSYDEAEMEAYVQGQMVQFAAEYAKYGMEMDPDEVKQRTILQAKQGWAARAYCASHGIELDLSGLEEEIDGIMQMQMLMGEETMDKETYVAMFTENQYLAKLFEALNVKIQSVMEG